MTPLWQQSVQYTETFEGGFVDNPLDHGGATNMGVTLSTLKDASAKLQGHYADPIFDGDMTIDKLKNLTVAEVEAIVIAEGYWIPPFDSINPVIAIKTFDLGFNLGIRSGIKLLQKAINDCGVVPQLVIDGVFGPLSIAACKAQDPKTLASHLVSEAVAHYEDIVEAEPSQAVFLKGWLRRATAMPTVA